MDALYDNLTNEMKLITLIISVFFLTGCSQEIEVNNKQGAQEALQVVEANITALNERDIDGYLETIVEDAHEGTRAATEELFVMDKIEFELLESFVVEEETKKFVIQTEQRAAADTDEYRDHLSTNMHTIEKINDEWKITASEILDINFE